MSAIDTTFETLRSAGKKAFVPFVTAGDPDLQFTRDVLLALDQVGSAVCEVGVPYSDPIADGPVIQASYTRALEQKFQVEDLLEMLTGLQGSMSAPRVTMVSYSIVYRHGVEAYIRAAVAAGVAGLIIPDLPVEESAAVASICREHEVSLIQLVTPTTSQQRAEAIVADSSGFIYCVSVTGITGERTAVPHDLVERIEWLRSKTKTPICVGFGVSTPEHVQQIAPIADGVIVGSAFVRRIADASQQPASDVIDGIRNYAESMIAALSPG